MGQSGSLAGKRRGILLIIEALDQRELVRGRLYRVYRCLCDCGKEIILNSSQLAPSKKSCGCLKSEAPKRRRKGSAADYSARRAWQLGYKDGCSLETFLKLSQQNCFYCGKPPSNSFNAVNLKRSSKEWYEQGTFIYNGLDRIDSSKDHSEDNLVPCCKMCNWMKNKYSLDVFIEHIKRIFLHLKL